MSEPVDTLLLGGLAYRPHPYVALIPYLRICTSDRLAADTQARFALDLSF